MLHSMKLSVFDLNRAKALHFLLEEAHVGRAAMRLGITPAAASNALRRLREDFDDPLLARHGRGLVRTRLGEALREPARQVMVATADLLQAARPFTPHSFEGELLIALADHVAALLLPPLDELVRTYAPRATLTVAPIPLDVSNWLKTSGGVMVGPAGPFAAIERGDALHTEDYFSERYVCVMRGGHPLADEVLTLDRYAEQGHVLVVPRGLTARSAIDAFLAEKGLARRILRVVPSFHLALPLVLRSDMIAAMPERNARLLSGEAVVIKDMPINTPALAMKLIWHPAHQADGRLHFMKRLLVEALGRTEAGV
jgi:DNA-binding transcriptional LysR family regulator